MIIKWIRKKLLKEVNEELAYLKQEIESSYKNLDRRITHEAQKIGVLKRSVKNEINFINKRQVRILNKDIYENDNPI